ncbi:hypothetical protein [Melghirimyces profundicolus]|uniref:hypothetical protein n=1 Tax=Melghirimyces profundicolus TaxID=1242148 RepID=UPI000D361688|nr:hypothetical protein [Melghirimyces profundicolus]
MKLALRLGLEESELKKRLTEKPILGWTVTMILPPSREGTVGRYVAVFPGRGSAGPGVAAPPRGGNRLVGNAPPTPGW